MVEVLLSTEDGSSSSPRIRLIKLLFPEPVSPLNVLTDNYYITFILASWQILGSVRNGIAAKFT